MQNPTNKVFDPSDFYPGEVRWDSFDVDPGKPLLPQMYEYDQDLMWIHFPNGCDLHVDWSAHPERSSQFVVSLAQVPDGQDWDPFEERRCESLAQLRGAVSELVQIAKKRPPLAR